MDVASATLRIQLTFPVHVFDWLWPHQGTFTQDFAPKVFAIFEKIHVYLISRENNSPTMKCIDDMHVIDVNVV